MAPSKSTTPNIISGGLAKPNSTKPTKKIMTVERRYTVHLKKAVIFYVPLGIVESQKEN
jgi:hypothetical protein